VTAILTVDDWQRRAQVKLFHPVRYYFRDSIFRDFFKLGDTVGIFVSRRSSFERKLSGRILLFHMRCACVFFIPHDFIIFIVTVLSLA